MQKGFSLIELCAVIVIAGLVTVGVGDMYRVNHQYIKATEDYNKFGRLSQALSEFYSINGRYPCPSDPSLPLTASSSGVEQVDFTTTPPQCIMTGGIVRTNNGTRRTLANTNPNPAATDFIAIGAFPYWTIINFLKTNGFQQLISQYDTLDSWNNQMTYVVTESMAAQAGVSPSDGAVDVQTESGQELTNPPKSAQYILLSHGDDGVGAYNQTGTISATCPAAGKTTDTQNCQYTIGNPNALFIDGLRSMGAGSTYFDDQVYFFAIPLNALWAPVANPLDTRPDIYNLNAGGVGIGTSGLPLGNPGNPDPKVQFQVDGNLRASQGNIVTPQICDSDGSNCFDPAFIGGPAIPGPATPQSPHPNTCPPGQTMSGITGDSTNYQVSCVPSGMGPTPPNQVLPTNSAGSASTGCGQTGYAVYGFELLGGGVWTPVCQLVQ